MFVPVAPGYWAFMPNTEYYTDKGQWWAGIGTYTNTFAMIMYDILLVDETKDDNGIVPIVKPATASAAFNKYYVKATITNENCVELHPRLSSKAQASVKAPKAKVDFKAISYQMPNRQAKMTVSASSNAASARPLAVKGGKIRKQDARVRR